MYHLSREFQFPGVDHPRLDLVQRDEGDTTIESPMRDQLLSGDRVRDDHTVHLQSPNPIYKGHHHRDEIINGHVESRIEQLRMV